MRLYIIILFAFILPWVIGILLFRKDKAVIVMIAPFACALGFILNTLGIDFGYFYPIKLDNIGYHTLSIFANAGLYAIEPCIFIFMVRHTKFNPFILNLFITLAGSFIDIILLKLNFLTYDNGWNIPWSAFAFFVIFYFIYFYYLWIKKLSLFPSLD